MAPCSHHDEIGIGRFIATPCSVTEPPKVIAGEPTRQPWHSVGVRELELKAGKASGPELFAEVMALGDKYYYAPIELKASAK